MQLDDAQPDQKFGCAAACCRKCRHLSFALDTHNTCCELRWLMLARVTPAVAFGVVCKATSIPFASSMVLRARTHSGIWLPAPRPAVHGSLGTPTEFGRSALYSLKRLSRSCRRPGSTVSTPTQARSADAESSPGSKLSDIQQFSQTAAVTVLVVESPTKASKIQAYLGPKFKV